MNVQQNYDRIAHSLARQLLQDEGYLVEKITGGKTLFHLIAWKKEEEILFIRIRRSRKLGMIQFSEDILQLSELVKGKSVPGVVELWILSNRNWKKYRILAGGAVPKDIGVIS